MTEHSPIGARIRATRQQTGITQDELAERVGVSRSAVAQWETGRAGQVTGNLTRIAASLGVSVEFLLHGDNPHAGRTLAQGDELALIRLYRECAPEDRQILLRMARRLAKA